jgi:hypothetical protein
VGEPPEADPSILRSSSRARRKRTVLRRGGHVLAAVIVIGGLLIGSFGQGVLGVQLLGEALVLLGLIWFFAPLLERVRGFADRGRR